MVRYLDCLIPVTQAKHDFRFAPFDHAVQNGCIRAGVAQCLLLQPKPSDSAPACARIQPLTLSARAICFASYPGC